MALNIYGYCIVPKLFFLSGALIVIRFCVCQLFVCVSKVMYVDLAFFDMIKHHIINFVLKIEGVCVCVCV